MEGAPYFPEYTPDDNPETKAEKDDREDDEDEKKPSKSFERDKDAKAEKTKDKTESEPDVPLERLAKDEKKTVVEQYVEARAEEVNQELSDVEPDTANEAEALVNAALLETIEEKLAGEAEVDDETLDEAVAETLDEFGIEAAEPSPTDDEPDADDTATPQPATPPVPPSPPSPPTPPTPPGGPPPPSPGPGGPGLPPFSPGFPGGPGGPMGGNILAPTHNAAPGPSPEESDSHHSHLKYVLAGGIVGYLIGRRRGRIKTEKKLLPIQKKLEKQAAELQAKVAEREDKIRAITRAQLARQPEVQQRVIERAEKRAAEKHEQVQQAKVENPERHERLGKFAMRGEPSPERLKRVDIMTLPELFAIAERIPIEQSNMRRLFETNRLNDKGLRRIVEAYLRGERYEKIVREVLHDDNMHERLASPVETEAMTEDERRRKEIEAMMGGDNHANAARDQLRQAAQGSSAPFAQWANQQQPKQKPKNNQTMMWTATAVGVVLALVFVLFILS